jgi:DNA-binding Lrp family transcriptional regulator
LIVSALPGDVGHVVKETGIPTSTVMRRLKTLHADGKIHIQALPVRANGGKPNPVYAAGPGEDAVYQVKTNAEKAKERRIRKALEMPATVDRSWLRPQDRRRALAEADRTAKTRDPMIEALFGPARRAA